MSSTSEEKDIERSIPQDEPATNVEAEVENEPSALVVFKGSNDPRNWTGRQKWSIAGMISAMTLLVYTCSLVRSIHRLTGFRNLSTLMCAPAAPLILRDFSSTDQLYETLLVSIWELGEAFGPLLIAPVSEMYGRAPVYHSANVLFCNFSIASALSKNLNMLIVFRFFNGITVAFVVLNPSIIGDMIITEQRGSAMSILTLSPLLGPVLGPGTGGYVSQSIGWRWLFWLAAIFAAAIEIVFAFFFRETYAVQILRQRAKMLRRQTDDQSYRSDHDSLQPQSSGLYG